MDVLMTQEICLLILKSAGIFFIIANFIYLGLLLVSWLRIKSFENHENEIDEGPLPPVSFLVPAYNEESLIVETIQTYLSLPQENKEIIIVNDGSHDKTMKLLQVMFQLKKTNDPTGRLFQSITYPILKVVEAPRLGKAGALNFGLQFTRYDLICTMDADTIPTARGVEACLHAFKRDPKLVAAGGVILVLSDHELKDNSPLRKRAKEWLTSFQRIEYLRTFICERLGWSFLDSTILISGAFCMLKKDAINKIGGFSRRSITEDFDLIVRLRSTFRGKDHRFTILPVTTCYTQVPRTPRHLSRQRMRWQMGLVQTLFQNGSLLLHPQHGFLGLFAIPYFWLVEAFSPLVALVAYSLLPLAIVNNWISLIDVLLFFGAGILFNMILTLFGIWFDDKYVSKKDSWSLPKSIIDIVLMHFGYKQMNLLWRLVALMKAATRAPTWGEKPRVEIIHRNY
jgi:cellulose synthase/poly-beta-1,6-N-acetylglucosamine synthase-like glycosyltransferase